MFPETPKHDSSFELRHSTKNNQQSSPPPDPVLFKNISYSPEIVFKSSLAHWRHGDITVIPVSLQLCSGKIALERCSKAWITIRINFLKIQIPA